MSHQSTELPPQENRTLSRESIPQGYKKKLGPLYFLQCILTCNGARKNMDPTTCEYRLFMHCTQCTVPSKIWDDILMIKIKCLVLNSELASF